MAANICWADPKRTECWSYGGRLYMSLGKAQIEQKKDIERRDWWAENHPDKPIPSWWADIPNVYHVDWGWSECPTPDTE